jgi:hypothetical protein
MRKLVPAQEYKDIALDSLLLDGETMYPLTRYLNFLQHARWILRDSFNHISSVKVRALCGLVGLLKYYFSPFPSRARSLRRGGAPG